MSVVGQAFVEVLPMSTGFAPALDRQLKGAMTQASATADTAFAGISRKVTLGVAAVAVGAVAASVKAATSFDTLTTSLVTGAGESERNLDKVRQGILNLAPAMGTSTTNLTNGLYMIESAGFHGAAGLDVLKASAEGAKVGNADLATVANAVTTALTDYHLPASQAASVTSMLVETVASGKTHMSDLAGALSTVLPVAAAAHVSLEDVNGALATMTGQGISAQQASQNVVSVIRALQNIGGPARQQLEQMGLSVTDLETGLGQRGLQGTLELVTNTIAKHMGPQGLVLVDALKQSQTATKDAAIEFSHLPASIQGIAKAYETGTVSQAAWRKDLKALPVDQRELAQQFAATINQSRGFNDALKSGSPAAKTLSATLSEVLGGATGLNAALALTGPNMGTYKQNLVNIYNAGVDAKTGLPTKEVQGFNLVQKDFGFQVDQARAGVVAFAITLGEKLIPVIQQGIRVGTEGLHWLTKHRDVALALAAVIGGSLLVVTGAYVALLIGRFASAVGRAASGVASLAGKLVGLGRSQTEAAAESAAGADAAIGSNEMLTASLAELNASVQALVTTLGGELPAALETVAAAEEETAAVSEETGGGFGPWGIAIGLLITGIVLLATHWRTVWKDIQAVAGAAWHWIDANVVRPVMDVVQPALEGIVHVVESVVGGIESAFDAVRQWFMKWWPVLLPIVLTLFLGPLGLLIGVVVDEIIKHWHTVLAVTEAVFRAVSEAVGAAWHWIDSNIIRPILGPLVAWIGDEWGIVSGVAHLVFDGIKLYFEIWWALVSTAFRVGLAVVEGILQEAWLIIRSVVVVYWDAIKTYFMVWWDVIRAIVQIGWDLIHGIFEVALDLIEGKWGAAWDAIKHTFSAIWDTIRQTASDVWGQISGFFTGAFNTFTGFWSSTWTNIATTFGNIWNGIAGGVSGVWSSITSGIASGIKDVENIINSAFINPINAVLGVFGVTITPFNTSGPAQAGNAKGQVTSGATARMAGAERGMVVNSPMVLVGEGRHAFPEYVIPTDPTYRGRAHALLGALLGDIGMPQMASGGIWGKVTGAASSVGGAVSGAAGAVAGGLKNALQWVDAHTVGPVIDQAAHAAEGLLGHVAPAFLGQTAVGIVKKVADGIKAMLGAGGGGPGLKGSIPSAAHAGLIDQALRLAGVGVTPGAEAAVNLIVTHESGWNPGAINLTDSNARAGYPSQGLMQTIPGTFEAYRLSSLPDVITDPLSNLVAGIRYAVSRYGSLMAVPGVAGVSRGGAYVGYDSGGWLMPGLTMAVNNTGVPERVISPSGAGPGGGITLAPGSVTVKVDLHGDASSAAGVKQLVEQGVRQGVTEALNDIMDRRDSRNLAGVR